MSEVRQVQTAFLAGELDPLLEGRTDTDLYPYGLAVCENFVPINEGPLVKRPGFDYIVDADPEAAWLSPFKFSISQEYVLEWAPNKLRFFTNGGRIETSPGEPYEVATLYGAAFSEVSTQQSYDRLYMDHPNVAPHALVRTGAETFAFSELALKNGPFLDRNSDEAIKVSVAGTLTIGGTVTVTATDPIFEAGDVGSPFKIEAEDFSNIKAWVPNIDVVSIGDVYRSDGKAYTAVTDGKTGNVTPEHDRGTEWDGSQKDLADDPSSNIYGVAWEFRHDRYGVLTITGFTSATEVTGTVTRRLPDGLLTVPSWRWAAGAFSTRRGWPSIVRHWAGRQFHIKDFDMHASVVGAYGGGTVDFEAVSSSGLVTADLGFRRTLETEDPPLWAVADKRGMLLGTASKELVVSAVNPQQAVTGENIQSSPESFYGSDAVAPAQIGTRTMFVERGGRRIRATGYEIQSDRYVPDDLTAAARHVTASGIRQATWHRTPHGLLYAVRNDGQLAVHADTRSPIKGWSRTVLGGGARALASAAVFGADGKTEEFWLLVERQRADGLKREIWKQREWREIGSDPWAFSHVDGGFSAFVTGGQTHFTGVTYLAGEAVAVVINGATIPGITIAADGSFDLPAGMVPSENYFLTVGLPYTATATTLRSNVQTSRGSTQGLRQKIRKVVLRVLESWGLVARSGSGQDENLIDRAASDDMDAAPPLYSGDANGTIEAEYDTSGQLTLTSVEPLPATITMAMLGIEVDGANA